MKTSTLILSHAAAVGLGWAIIGTSLPTANAGNTRLPGKSHQREERQSQAREILARLDSDMSRPTSPTSPSAADKAAIQQAAEIRLASLALPSDIGAAIEEAYQRINPPASDAELAALLLGWGRRDLASTVRWLDRGRESARRAVEDAIGEKLGYEIDPQVALKLEDHHFDDSESFLQGLARQFFDTCSLDEIIAFALSTRVSPLSELPYTLVTLWPLDRPEDLVKFGSFMPEGLLGSSLSQWVWENRSLAPEVRQKLAPGIRLGESDESITLEFLLRGDLSAFLCPAGQPEPERDFTVGLTDAIGLLREFQQRFPGYYAESDLRACLFAQLGAIDPLRAAALLDPLNSGQRRAAIESAVDGNGPVHPDIVREWLSLLPLPSNEADLRDRFTLWERGVGRYDYFQVSGDYQDWVMRLPPGVSRDLALASLAKALEPEHHEDAASFRNQISDPAIREFR